MLLMGKSTISTAIFNSYVKLPEGISRHCMLLLGLPHDAKAFGSIFGSIAIENDLGWGPQDSVQLRYKWLNYGLW